VLTGVVALVLLVTAAPAAAGQTTPSTPAASHDFAAGIPGRYVLAGHSFGGLFGRLDTSTYLDEAVGLVLVNAYSAAWYDVHACCMALNSPMPAQVPAALNTGDSGS
jgi:hypothetical protein